MADDLPEPIPAATLVLMRPAGSGPPELLTIERSAGMAFAAGALAFPGGRIDEEDCAAAAAYPALTDAAARIAAIRETIEETGLGGSLAPGDLTPFARWCPNFRETRRFDTLFYLAEAASDWPAPVAAAHEVGRVFWASAAAILAEIGAGRAHAIFPTRRNLERLARFGSIEEALGLLEPETDVFVIGGGEIYAAALPYADELLLTEIDADVEGDTIFPTWDRDEFEELARERHVTEEGTPFAFVTYRRRRDGS